MKKPIHPVTDHALIRYLERVKGVNIEALRHEIGRIVDDGLNKGVCGVQSAGFTYRIEGGRVVTVYRSNRPNIRTGCVKDKRGSVDETR